MQRRTDIEIEKLSEGLWRLTEFDFANCFLVEGSEKACLIDAGAGVADLAAVVKTLTQKPLTVLITHAHADHVGGAVWFPEVYIHPADLRMGKVYTRAYQRLYFLHSHEYKRRTHNIPYSAALQKNYDPRLLPLNEGETFDLGGRAIETYFTPGHTVGGLTFRDTLTGTLFPGDNVNPMVTLQFPFATSMEIWLRSAKRTLSLAGESEIRGGHGADPVSRQTLETVIGWAEDLVAAGNVFPGKTVTKRGAQKYPCIVYKTNQIR